MYKRFFLVILIFVCISNTTYGDINTDMQNAAKAAIYYEQISNSKNATDSEIKLAKETAQFLKFKVQNTYSQSEIDSAINKSENSVTSSLDNNTINGNIDNSDTNSNTFKVKQNNPDNPLSEETKDILSEYKEVNKQISTLDGNIKIQQDAIAEIELIQNGEGEYGEKSIEERQADIDKQYDIINSNGGDANGWVGKNNIKEAKESILEQENTKKQLQSEVKTLQVKAQTQVNNEREQFEREFDAEQEAARIKKEKTLERVDTLTNNANAIKDLEKNNSGAEFDLEQQTAALKTAESKLNTASMIAGAKDNLAKEKLKEYEDIQQKSIDADANLEKLKNDLKEAKENGESLEEISNLQTKIHDAEGEANLAHFKANGDSAKKLKEEADKAQEEANKAQEEVNKAKTTLASEKEKTDKLNKEAIDTKAALENAKEANATCLKDPDNCKKVYSPEQKKTLSACEKPSSTECTTAKKSCEGSNSSVCKDVVSIEKKAIEEITQADKAVANTFSDVESKCKNGDTAECRAAITEMNKAEANRACLDSGSKACTDAQKMVSDSEKLTDEYTKKEAAEKIKKEKAEAQKIVDDKIDLVNEKCSEGDTVECREAIAEMNEAEANKECVEPSSQACSDAKAITANSEAITEAYIAEILANPGLARIKKGDSTIMESLLGKTESNVVTLDSSEGGFTVLSSITVWIKNSLTSLVMFISVGAFLFVGIRLAFARGNPEEFKKALVHMIYVIVGIFVITISWAAVTLVAGLNI